MEVICISGKAGSGKDTFGQILADQLTSMGKTTVIAHYADLLKYIAKQFFGWNGEKDEEGRSLLQTIGTDIVRQKNENFWVHFLISMAKFFGDNWDYMIIPDTRFPNEITEFQNQGYKVRWLKISRQGKEWNHLTSEQAEHISETALDNWNIPDCFIYNTGTMDDLKDTAQIVAKEIIQDDL